MNRLRQFFPAASLLLICLWRLAAADAPAPQPTDPSSGACQFDVGFGLYDLSALNVSCVLPSPAPLMTLLQKLGKQVLPTNIGTLYFSPCSPIRAADCSALCCLNTDGGRWASCGFAQGVGGPLVGSEFSGVDGFQVALLPVIC
jgi:hypothetical protein